MIIPESLRLEVTRQTLVPQADSETPLNSPAGSIMREGIYDDQHGVIKVPNEP